MSEPSPVPAVTRDQVQVAIAKAVNGTTWLPDGITDATDAVMALLAGAPSCPYVRGDVTKWCSLAEAPQTKVLWQGETTFLGSRSNPAPGVSWFLAPYSFAVEGYPPGTKVAVVVVEAPASPAPKCACTDCGDMPSPGCPLHAPAPEEPTDG